MATKAEQKAEMIDLLIENTEASGFSEDDREDLETMTLGGLQRCIDLAELTAETVENAEEEEDDDKMDKARKGKKYVKNKGMEDDEEEEGDEEEGKKGKGKGKGKKMTKNAAKPGKTKKVSVLQTNSSSEDEEEDVVFNEEDQASIDEYIENAPPGYRDMIQNGIKSFENQKKQLVDMVVNHDTNIFEKAWLVQQPMDVLKGLVALTQNNRNRGRGNFIGAAGAAPASSPIRNADEEGLGLPTMGFSKN